MPELALSAAAFDSMCAADQIPPELLLTGPRYHAHVLEHHPHGATPLPANNHTACVVHATGRNTHIEWGFYEKHNALRTFCHADVRVPPRGSRFEIEWLTRDAQYNTTTHNCGRISLADAPVDAYWVVFDAAAHTISFGAMLSDTERGPVLFDIIHPSVARCTHHYAAFYELDGRPRPLATARSSLVQV